MEDNKCSICGTVQVQIGGWYVSFGSMKFKSPMYNINLLTSYGKYQICDNCIHNHNKIKSLEIELDFSSGGNNYYADGRNLI